MATLFGAWAALVLLPDVLRVDRFSPFVQLVAFRPVGLRVAAAAAVGLGLAAIPIPRLRPYAASLALPAAAAAVRVLPRTWAGAPRAGTGQPLTVLAFNALARADLVELTALIERERPDLVALPEAGPRYRSRLAPLVEGLGYRVIAADNESGSELAGITVLVAGRLGAVRQCPGPAIGNPSVELTGGALGSLRFVAVHPVAPAPGMVGRWRRELAAVFRGGADGAPAVVAGDFNASLDHSVLRDATAGWRDAAAQCGAALVGTWPSFLPRWVGLQIDHVFTTGGIAARGFAVHDVPGSDHRAVVAHLDVPSGELSRSE